MKVEMELFLDLEKNSSYSISLHKIFYVGRQFYKCGQTNMQCNFFLWHDEQGNTSELCDYEYQ